MLLTAIAKARVWVTELVKGRTGSFTEIARREGKVERHIRLLAPLAFVSPKIVASIADIDPCPCVTDLAKALAFSWRRQKLDLTGQVSKLHGGS